MVKIKSILSYLFILIYRKKPNNSEMILEVRDHKEKKDQEELQIRFKDNINVIIKNVINHTVQKDHFINTLN
jgi:hypothetical protein